MSFLLLKQASEESEYLKVKTVIKWEQRIPFRVAVVFLQLTSHMTNNSGCESQPLCQGLGWGRWDREHVVWHASWDLVCGGRRLRTWGASGGDQVGMFQLRLRSSGFFPQPGHWLAVWLWVSQLHFLCHPFSFVKQTKLKPNLQKSEEGHFPCRSRQEKTWHLHLPLCPCVPWSSMRCFYFMAAPHFWWLEVHSLAFRF